jgi:hypothetical protein
MNKKAATAKDNEKEYSTGKDRSFHSRNVRSIGLDITMGIMAKGAP